MRNKVRGERIRWSIALALLLNTLAHATPHAMAAERAEDLVYQLYRDYGWEAVMEDTREDALFSQPPATFARYFDTEMTALLLKERTCAEKLTLCRLDFDPLWDSHDPVATNLTIEKMAAPGSVRVQFRDPTNNRKVTLLYQLTQTALGWRISNISGEGWSLRSILSAK